MKRIIFVSVLLMGMTGCHTLEGMGEDLQAGGRALANAAGGTSSKNDSDKNQVQTTTQAPAPSPMDSEKY